MSSTQVVLSGCSALLSVFLLTRLLYRRNSAPYPPGPKSLPFFGNMFSMPTDYIWRTFTEWGQIHGGIVYVNVLGQHIVILNSAKQAKSMLDNKSSIYSDRPVLQMGGELVGWSEALGMKPYGQQYRERRRYIHNSIGTKTAMKQHYGVLISEDKKFLKRLLGDSGHIDSEIRRTALAIMLRITYGYTLNEGADSDPMTAPFEKALATLDALKPGAWLVDVLPFLRHFPSWIPGMGFKQTAAEMRKSLHDMADMPYDFTKQEMNKGTELPPNLVEDNLRKGHHLDTDAEHCLKWAAASIYSGGGDTTVSTMHTFILAMTLYPDIQKRAQAEIDVVVGNGRLPSFEDRENLPFVEAVVKETLRWRCPAPLTFPHRCMEDDVHEGYFIPKGTIVFANIWAMLRNPEEYPNPDVFDPNRYFAEGDDTSISPDPYDICFGFGRRICPGINLTDTSIFIWCAMILSVYDISKTMGPDGSFVEPNGEYTSTPVSHPKPFKYSIVPRSEKAEMLIRSLD